MPKIFSSSCHLSRAPCRLIRTASLPSCSLHCPHPLHLHFRALAQRRFNQEHAPIHTVLEVTVLRNPILSQVMSPTWLSTSFSRSSQNRRVLNLLKIVKFWKLRIRSPYRTTSHYCLRPRIQRKALPHLERQTWMTNEFVLCWLHHGTCQSAKQVRNDHKFITPEKKV